MGTSSGMADERPFQSDQAVEPAELKDGHHGADACATASRFMSTASIGMQIGAEREEQHEEGRAHDESDDLAAGCWNMS